MKKTLSFRLLNLSFVDGPLAQLVEQLTLNQRVRSSSLRRPTKNKKPDSGLFVFEHSGSGT